MRGGHDDWPGPPMRAGDLGFGDAGLAVGRVVPSSRPGSGRGTQGNESSVTSSESRLSVAPHF